MIPLGTLTVVTGVKRFRQIHAGSRRAYKALAAKRVGGQRKEILRAAGRRFRGHRSGHCGSIADRPHTTARILLRI